MIYTNVYDRTRRKMATDKVIFNQGGARSSKSHSIAQILIEECQKRKIKCYALRTTMISCLLSCDRLCQDIVKQEKINVKITKWKIFFKETGSEIIFSTPKKLEECDLSWMEESDEFSVNDFNKVVNLTRENVFLSFNPFVEDKKKQWLYNKVSQAKIIKSTYKDNPFIVPEFISTLESIKDKDQDIYRRFVLGEF